MSYHEAIEQKYLQITRTVIKVDEYWKMLRVNNIRIDF